MLLQKKKFPSKEQNAKSRRSTRVRAKFAKGANARTCVGKNCLKQILRAFAIIFLICCHYTNQNECNFLPENPDSLSTNETGRQARSQRPIFDNEPLRARRRNHKKMLNIFQTNIRCVALLH